MIRQIPIYIVDQQNGIYVISFTPDTHGKMNLAISIRGVPIKVINLFFIICIFFNNVFLCSLYFREVLLIFMFKNKKFPKVIYSVVPFVRVIKKKIFFVNVGVQLQVTHTDNKF